MRFRPVVPSDASQIAHLHAESWRLYYRGAFADSYLDGDVVADRQAVWSSRLASPADSVTFVAVSGSVLAGFVHVMLDSDDTWGSLVDNLHVAPSRQGAGLGRALLVRAAAGVVDRAVSKAMFLWVLEQNTRAQRFYAGLGGVLAEKAPVTPPGGVQDRLNGSPTMLRIVWADAASVANEAHR